MRSRNKDKEIKETDIVIKYDMKVILGQKK